MPGGAARAAAHCSSAEPLQPRVVEDLAFADGSRAVAERAGVTRRAAARPSPIQDRSVVRGVQRAEQRVVVEPPLLALDVVAQLGGAWAAGLPLARRRTARRRLQDLVLQRAHRRCAAPTAPPRTTASCVVLLAAERADRRRRPRTPAGPRTAMKIGSIAIALSAEYGELWPSAISLTGSSCSDRQAGARAATPAKTGRSAISPIPQLREEGIENSGTSAPARRPASERSATHVLHARAATPSRKTAGSGSRLRTRKASCAKVEEETRDARACRARSSSATPGPPRSSCDGTRSTADHPAVGVQQLDGRALPRRPRCSADSWSGSALRICARIAAPCSISAGAATCTGVETDR